MSRSALIEVSFGSLKYQSATDCAFRYRCALHECVDEFMCAPFVNFEVHMFLAIFRNVAPLNNAVFCGRSVGLCRQRCYRLADFRLSPGMRTP